MTEATEQNINEPIPDTPTTDTTESPRLYANKYKSVDELESGYRQTSSIVKGLQSEIDTLKKVPENYEIPDALKELPEGNIELIKSMGREANLTQENFNQFADAQAKRLKDVSAQRETEKNTLISKLGADGSIKLKEAHDYVDKNYPATIAPLIKDRLERDEATYNDIVRHRESTIAGTTPGIHSHATPTIPTKESVHALGRKVLKNPQDLELRKRYIEETKAYAEINPEKVK